MRLRHRHAREPRPFWEQLPNGRVHHRLEPVIFALAILSLPLTVIEVGHPPESWDPYLSIADWVIWVGFALEFVFVLVVASRKRAALGAHAVDLAIVILTLPALVGVLAAIRVVRLARLPRLGLYGTRALQSAKHLTNRNSFRFVALATTVVVVVCGAAVAMVDRQSFPSIGDGVWWAIETVTTVGYGDYVPKDTSGRVIAVVLMFVGIGFLSLLTAAFAFWFVQQDSASEVAREQSAEAELSSRLGELEARLEQLDRPDKRLPPASDGEILAALARIEQRLAAERR